MTSLDAAIEHIAAGRMRLTPMPGLPAKTSKSSVISVNPNENCFINDFIAYRLLCTSSHEIDLLHLL